MAGETITLLHGTSSSLVEFILQKGLKQPYLTDSEELAEYYAGVVSEDYGGSPVILKVTVGTAALLFDGCAMNEPVGYNGLKSDDLMAKISEEYGKLAIIHPEWTTRSGRDVLVSVPEKEYQISLSIVGSCRTNEIISPDRVERF